jgi:hypothetical protein
MKIQTKQNEAVIMNLFQDLPVIYDDLSMGSIYGNTAKPLTIMFITREDTSDYEGNLLEKRVGPTFPTSFPL